MLGFANLNDLIEQLPNDLITLEYQFQLKYLTFQLFSLPNEWIVCQCQSFDRCRSTNHYLIMLIFFN